MLTGAAAEFSVNRIHGEIFSVSMPGSVQKQINDMLTNSAVVYNTQRESNFWKVVYKSNITVRSFSLP